MIDITKPYYLVLIHDPAIDQEKFKRNQYLESRDPSLVVEKPGMRALRWHFRPLSKAIVQILDAGWTSEQARNVMTFKLALMAIESRANRATPDFDTINFGNEKREIISNGFFESVWNRFGLETITTLGRIVYELECSARVANPFDSDLSLLVGQVQKTSNT
jgi:hypothetical protein